MQHDKLQCGVQMLRYDFDKQAGELFIDEGECCDMKACIQLFEKISSAVSDIQTYSGGKVDTAYVYDFERGGWRATSPKDVV